MTLLPLPWDRPLTDWPDDLLVSLPRGISRHTVRFIQVGPNIYAAKELVEESAVHEYRILQDLKKLDTPCVDPIAVVTERLDADGNPLDPVLLTRHLAYSMPYRAMFSAGVRHGTVSRLLDAMILLLVQLHLEGFLWGDVSLSNVLFRRDAGSFAAYLVDAETGALYETLTKGQREHDLDIARTNLFGEFCDLEAGHQLDPHLDPQWLVDEIMNRYAMLWEELTGTQEVDVADTAAIERRIRRLNTMGFEVTELGIETSKDGQRLRMQPKVVDPGYNARRLFRLTGLDAHEHQAQRLLADMASYRITRHLEDSDESVVAHDWLRHQFDPVIEAVPREIADQLDPVQLYHEVLDYRWYASEAAGHSIPLATAALGYVHDVLSTRSPEDLTALAAEQPPASNESLGLDEPIPHDPWKGSAAPPEAELLPEQIDLATLRRLAQAKANEER